MDDNWRERYIVSTWISNPGERAALYRAAARGAFVRVVRGVYLPTDYWDTLGVEARHLARMRATELVYPGTVFSHLSAAIAWQLPVVGGDLALPWSVISTTSGGRSITGLRRCAIGIPSDLRLVGGLTVTPPALTTLHVATAFAPEVSVPLLDAALALPALQVDRTGLLDAVGGVPASSGVRRGEWAIGFADSLSGSPGESVSRVGIYRLRLPPPVLQQRFEDARGLVGVTDFWWPDAQVIGEFDGVGKYLREAFRDGRTPAEVVVDEKRREDRLRALGPRLARWGWAEARDLGSLRRRLEVAGLRPR